MYTLMETVYNIKNLFSQSCDRGKDTVSSLSALLSQVPSTEFIDLTKFSEPQHAVVINEISHWDSDLAEIILKLFHLNDSIDVLWDSATYDPKTGSLSLGTISMVKGETSYNSYCPNLYITYSPSANDPHTLEYHVWDVITSLSGEKNELIHGYMRRYSNVILAGSTSLYPIVDNHGVVFSWLDILEGLNQNLSICTVFETAANLLSTGNLTVANFCSAIQANLSGLKDQALTLYKQIINAIPLGVRSVLEVILDWIHVISNSEESAGTWTFSDTRYSTNGFCWGAFISVATTVVQVVGMVVLAFSKIAGIVISLVGTVAKGIFEFFNNKLNDSTYASIDANSCNNNFATAVVQQTFHDSEVDQWRVNFFNGFMPALRLNGFYKVVAAGLEGWMWYVDDHSFNLELFPSARFKVDSAYSSFYDYGSQSAAIYVRHKNWRTDETYGVSTEILMQGNAQPIDVDTFANMDKAYSTKILLQRGYASAFWAATCIDIGTYYEVDPQGVPGSAEHQACYALLKYVSEQMANSYREAIPNNKWEELTNYNTPTSGIAGAIIDVFKYNYGNALKNLCGHILNMFNTNFPDSSVPGSEDCVYPIFLAPSRGLDAFYPPEYTEWAIKSSLIATTAIIVITTAVAVAGVLAWKRFASMKAASITRETEKAWEDYKRTGSKDDLKTYRACCLKQNTLGKIVGCSVVSNSNFWAASSCDTSGVASNITDNIAVLTNALSPTDGYIPIDPVLNDLLKLIKGSI